MFKKLIFLVFFIYAITMPTVTLSLSQENQAISFEDARQFLLKNNINLLKADMDISKAQMQYNTQIEVAKTIDVKGMYDPYTKVALSKQKYLQVAQLKYSVDTLIHKELLTQNTMELNLRDIYLAVCKAHRDVEIKTQNYDLAKRKYEQSNIKLDSGYSEGIVLIDSYVGMKAAENEIKAAQRNEENYLRILNNLLCRPIDIVYKELVLYEQQRTGELKPAGFYIQEAMNNRFDIINLRDQIDLKQQEKAILETAQAHQIYSDLRNNYRDIVYDLEKLNLNLEKTKIDVEDEIKDAYIDIFNEDININVLRNTITLQSGKLKRLNTQYEQGLVTKTNVLDLKIIVNELENNLKLSVFDYNTKLLRLEYAAGIGPAYTNGGNIQ